MNDLASWHVSVNRQAKKLTANKCKTDQLNNIFKPEQQKQQQQQKRTKNKGLKSLSTSEFSPSMDANRNRNRNDSGVKDDGVNILSLLRRTLSKRIVDARKDAHKVTIAVMGARRVGKSSILAQYLSHTFETKYRPTVDEYYIHMTHMEGWLVG